MAEEASGAALDALTGAALDAGTETGPDSDTVAIRPELLGPEPG